MNPDITNSMNNLQDTKNWNEYNIVLRNGTAFFIKEEEGRYKNVKVKKKTLTKMNSLRCYDCIDFSMQIIKKEKADEKGESQKKEKISNEWGKKERINKKKRKEKRNR